MRPVALVLLLPATANALQADAMPRKAEPVHQLHIAKTAGTSLHFDLMYHAEVNLDNWAPEHCYTGWWARQKKTVTFLRDPRAHVYSQWMHCRDNKDHWFNPRHLPSNMTAWLQHYDTVGDKPLPRGNQSGKVFHCYHPMNMQTRYLSCKHDRLLGCASPAMDTYIFKHNDYNGWGGFTADFAIAKQNLQELHFVGITEFYQESLCVLHVKEKGEFPDYCNCEDTESWKTFPMTRATHGGKHGTVESDLGSGDIALIDRLTQDDSKLYTIAKKRLFDDIAEAERAWKKRILCNGGQRTMNNNNTIELYVWDYEPGDYVGAKRPGHGGCNALPF